VNVDSANFRPTTGKCLFGVTNGKIEHNWSAFRHIATGTPLLGRIETDRQTVIQAPERRGRIMRYELSDDDYLAFVQLASIRLWLRVNESAS
jgi:hypothetical protein